MVFRLTLCTIVAAALLSGFTHGATPLLIRLSARGLPLSDPIGRPDTYVKISYAFGTSEQFEAVGRTLPVDETTNPNWPEVYDFDFVPGTSQRLRFEIWDDDLFDAHDYIGDVEVFLAEISNAANGTLVKRIQPAGRGNFTIRNILNSNMNILPQQIELQ